MYLHKSIFPAQLSFLLVKTLISLADRGVGQQERYEGETCGWKLAIPNRSSLLHLWPVDDKTVGFKNGQWVVEKHSAGLPECADDSRRVCACVFHCKRVAFTFILLSRVLKALFRSGVFSEGDTACH